MKHYLLIPLIIILSVIMPLSVNASDITDALYTGTIQASNNSTLASNVSANFTLNTAGLIAAGHLNAGATNVVARDNSGYDIAVMPGYGSNPWVIWYDSIPAISSQSAYIYTGNVSGGKVYYFPGNGGMTVPDNASLEWGTAGNFTVQCSFNPTSTENILLKTDAIKINGCGDGAVYASTYNGTSANITFRPNAAGDVTQLTPSAGNNYSCVSDDNDATYVSTNGTTNKYDLYNITNHTTQKGFIDSVTVYLRIKTNNVSYLTAGKPIWYIGGVSYNGTDLSTFSTSFYTVSQTYTTSPATSLPWTWAALDSAQFGVWLYGSNASSVSSCADVWYSVSQGTGVCEVTGVTAAEHTFKLGLSGGTLSFQVDSGTPDTAAFTGNVTNNANNWIIGDDNITPYIVSASMGVGASVVSAWAWEYGATFNDSIGSNDATPVFRTTSSDSDVTTTLISYSPVNLAVADAGTISTWPSMITAAPDQPTTMYTEDTHPGIFFEPMVDAVWPDSIPVSFFWYNFAFLIILAAGILSFYLMASKSQNGLFLKCIITAVIMIFFALPGPNIYGMYVAIYYIMFCFGVIVLSRNYGW